MHASAGHCISTVTKSWNIYIYTDPNGGCSALRTSRKHKTLVYVIEDVSATMPIYEDAYNQLGLDPSCPQPFLEYAPEIIFKVYQAIAIAETLD
jgi:hypothetical protein